MKYYYIAKTSTSGFVGAFTIEQIAAQLEANAIRRDFVATESTDLSYNQLMKIGGATWVPVSQLLANHPTLPRVNSLPLPPISETTHCHVFYAGQQHGPYTPQQIKMMWSVGTLTADTSVLPADFPNWISKNKMLPPPHPSVRPRSR